jgi:Resolvase, N terminal domain
LAYYLGFGILRAASLDISRRRPPAASRRSGFNAGSRANARLGQYQFDPLGRLPITHDIGCYRSHLFVTGDHPALKRLLADVAKGCIDIVAVYKVDRLSRSLMDFQMATEMALHVLAYNLTRVMNTVGTKPLLAAVRA